MSVNLNSAHSVVHRLTVAYLPDPLLCFWAWVPDTNTCLGIQEATIKYIPTYMHNSMFPKHPDIVAHQQSCFSKHHTNTHMRTHTHMSSVKCMDA